jgi:predicted nucleic acid-binding protein
MYLIDSDIVIYHLNGQAQAQAFLLRLLNSPVFLSAVTYMEVEEGIALSSNVALAAQRWQQVQGATVLLPFDQAEAHRAAGIRRQFRSQGLSVRSRPLDIMIAATALENGLTLATNNPADYRGIPGLLIETP